MIFWNI